MSKAESDELGNKIPAILKEQANTLYFNREQVGDVRRAVAAAFGVVNPRFVSAIQLRDYVMLKVRQDLGSQVDTSLQPAAAAVEGSEQ